jgi:hypothetical protein
MKSLWIMARDGTPNATYEGGEYRLGWWDDEAHKWQLNDDLAVHLLALLEGLKWGNPGKGEIPNLEIITR